MLQLTEKIPKKNECKRAENPRKCAFLIQFSGPKNLKYEKISFFRIKHFVRFAFNLFWTLFETLLEAWL